MNDRRLAALLFPIEGIQSDKFSLRFLRIREALPQDNWLPIRMQRWADRLWRRELRCPVYPTTLDKSRGFLIPSEAASRSGFPKAIKLREVPDREYTVELTDQLREISVQQALPPECDLICRMVERPFTDLLLTKQSQFWRAQWTLFFPMEPANATVTHDIMNAFRGFKFGVVFLSDGLYLALDIRTRYISRKSLSDFTSEEKESVLCDHLNLALKLADRASLLRDNGPRKIPCRYAGETNKTVSTFEFEPGRTVADYYARTYGLKLDENDQAVFVKDRAADESAPALAAPSSRLFPVFTTEFDGVKFCSVKPWMNPAERYSAAREVLSHLSGAWYGNRQLVLSDNLFSKQRSVFLPPTLEFGQGRTLKPFQGRVPRPEEEAFDSQVVRWGSRKYPMLLQAHPQQNEPLPDLVLLYPEHLPREVRETFVADVGKEVALQTGQSLRVVQYIQYSSGKKEKMGGSLLRRVPDVKSLPKRHLALVVLSDDFDASVHGELKDRIRPNLSQCVMESTVFNIAKQRNPQRARSQVRNLALAILVEAGLKPWVLAEPLHHDAYIGIDLLYGRVAYHAFFGTGGRVMTNRVGESQLRGKMREGIKSVPLRDNIEDLIREMTAAGHRPQSIVVHRDGRWWSSESKGFERALARLQSDHALPADLKWAVVEVHKNHMPVRLFTLSNPGASMLLQNPLPGSYLVVDERRVLLTTTGRPGAWDTPNGRTAGTLLLQIVEQSGGIAAEHIAEDAYCLTHLNWTSPEIEISLPITIRWADESLRETLRPTAGEEEDEEESNDAVEEDIEVPDDVTD
jgi:Piwi domain